MLLWVSGLMSASGSPRQSHVRLSYAGSEHSIRASTGESGRLASRVGASALVLLTAKPGRFTFVFPRVLRVAASAHGSTTHGRSGVSAFAVLEREPQGMSCIPVRFRRRADLWHAPAMNACAHTIRRRSSVVRTRWRMTRSQKHDTRSTTSHSIAPVGRMPETVLH